MLLYNVMVKSRILQSRTGSSCRNVCSPNWILFRADLAGRVRGIVNMRSALIQAWVGFGTNFSDLSKPCKEATRTATLPGRLMCFSRWVESHLS